MAGQKVAECEQLSRKIKSENESIQNSLLAQKAQIKQLQNADPQIKSLNNT